MDTKIYIYIYKGTCLKIPLQLNEIFTSNVSAVLDGRRLSLKSEGSLEFSQRRVFSDGPPNFAILRVCGLREATHSEGGAGHSPLRSRRAQRSSLGTAV